MKEERNKEKVADTLYLVCQFAEIGVLRQGLVRHFFDCLFTRHKSLPAKLIGSIGSGDRIMKTVLVSKDGLFLKIIDRPYFVVLFR